MIDLNNFSSRLVEHSITLLSRNTLDDPTPESLDSLSLTAALPYILSMMGMSMFAE